MLDSQQKPILAIAIFIPYGKQIDSTSKITLNIFLPDIITTRIYTLELNQR